VGVPRERQRHERLPHVRTPAACAFRSLLSAVPHASRLLSACPALSGHTDAKALDALKLRWIKAGKPNLTEKCVKSWPTGLRSHVACLV
jgi:hypothetical protein